MTCSELRREEWFQQPRGRIREHQLRRLNDLLKAILPTNRFYARKLAGVSLPVSSLDEIQTWPFTTKEELSRVAQSTPAELRTFPDAAYTRVHRTSGTTGPAMYVYDTPQDWEWWIRTWQYVLDAVEVQPQDRAFMAVSFGPFIGFWSAFDALVHRGSQVIPAGGMPTEARLRMLLDLEATLVFCTPSYAVRMIEVAQELSLDLKHSAVRAVVVAGEPGGSVPTTRQRIEAGWGARVVDHAGATEVGPWGVADATGTGLYVIESEFLAEWLPWSPEEPSSSDMFRKSALLPAPTHELVITSLGRQGMPAIRYRTGDLAAPEWNRSSPSVDGTPHDDVPGFVFLRGGILGRVDDMFTIRGINIFPQTIESVLRRHVPTGEYRLVLRRPTALDELSVQVEADHESASQVVQALHTELGLRVNVESVPHGFLPRSEDKARRVLDLR